MVDGKWACPVLFSLILHAKSVTDVQARESPNIQLFDKIRVQSNWSCCFGNHRTACHLPAP